MGNCDICGYDENDCDQCNNCGLTVCKRCRKDPVEFETTIWKELMICKRCGERGTLKNPYNRKTEQSSKQIDDGPSGEGIDPRGTDSNDRTSESRGSGWSTTGLNRSSRESTSPEVETDSGFFVVVGIFTVILTAFGIFFAGPDSGNGIGYLIGYGLGILFGAFVLAFIITSVIYAEEES